MPNKACSGPLEQSILPHTMALAEATEKLAELLSCPVCLDTYTNPKMLLCSHVFCQDCLARLVVRGRRQRYHLTCPNCRLVTSAYLLSDLKEIQETLRANCPAGFCSTHLGNALELYCETCEELICWRCAYKDVEHHSHDHLDVAEVTDTLNSALTQLL